MSAERTVTYKPEAPSGKPAGQPAAESTTLGRLGEYQLLDKLGEGGMGVVYRARHTKLDREVALKVLPRGRIGDEQARARFQREMKAVGRLDHSNVVRAHDAGEIEGTWFLVMEFVDGLDLSRFVRSHGPLPVADACEVIRQAALGLQSAHEHGLVHRDVKPSNLMLTGRGEVKVLDLGLARFQLDQPAAEEMTATGHAMGTLDYMAPEQISDTHSVDIRADVYALGCTLYKLLTGQAPFTGPKYDTPFDKMRGHLEEPVPPIRRARRDVPPELVAVINRMLAKEPGLRFGTPAEVADAIGPLAGGSDLAGLLDRVDRRKPPVVRPSRSLEATEGSPSSGLTRFFERMKIKSPPPRPGVEQPVRTTPTIIIGSAAVGILLLAILIALGVKSSRGPTEAATALVLDWPQNEREGVTLYINGRERSFPNSGPLALPCESGKYGIRAQRDGFKLYEEVVPVGPGQRKNIPWPKWQRHSYLVLVWPVDDRKGSTLTIDGEVPDIPGKPNRNQVKVPSEPGEYSLRINGPGPRTFEKEFTIVQGEDTTIRVDWPPPSGETIVVTPPVHPDPPDPDPPEPPAETEQDYLAALLPIRRMVAAGDFGGAAERLGGLHFEQEEFADRLQRYRDGVQPLADYAEAVEPVRKLVAGWDFVGAAAALEKVQVQREDLVARLAARRTMVGRLATLKQKIIEEIEGAVPPKRKIELGIRGIPGDLIEADADGLTAKLTTGKTETHRWAELTATSREKLLELAVDPGSADDLLAAGLLALDAGDGRLTETYIAKALHQAEKVKPYLVAFAEAEFARAEATLQEADDLPKEEFAQEEELFEEAAKVLADIQERYAQTSWLEDEDNRGALDAAAAQAAAGILRAEADWLYVEAERYSTEDDLFYAEPLVKKLKDEYADTRAVDKNDDFAKMYQAVAGLGELFIVRKTPQADTESKQDLTLPEKIIQEAIDAAKHFSSIQKAIAAAPRNSLVEIHDSETYDEAIVIIQEKEGLTLRGKKGCWPTITSSKPTKELVVVVADGTTLERLALAHGAPVAPSPRCLAVRAAKFRLSSTILYIENVKDCRGLEVSHEDESEVEGCLFLSSVLSHGRIVFRDSLLPGWIDHRVSCRFQSCTILDLSIMLDGLPALRDCIVRSISNPRHRPYDIEYCNLFNQALPSHIQKEEDKNHCRSVNPLFCDPKNFDFRLQEKDAAERPNPCLTAASDGEAIGVRYTPEMVEMCCRAAELKEEGRIKFTFEYKP